MHTFNTIKENATAEFSDKGSKFVAYAFSIESADQFKEHLKHLRILHPKAVHHCFAYRLGLDKNNYRSNDDGEPSGSAGKPILGQIDSMQLTDVLVIVVRYFGGVLLGVPGLINAYKTSTALALKSTSIITKQVKEDYLFEFDYLQLDTLLGWAKRNNFAIRSKELDMFCRVVISLPTAESVADISKLNRHIKVTKV